MMLCKIARQKYCMLCHSYSIYLSKRLKLTCHQAKKAQSTLDMHTSSHPTVSLNDIFELFDCLIKPVLTYGCAVWGSGNIAEIKSAICSL